MSPATTILETATRMIRALEADFARHANARDAAAVTDQYYADDAQLLPPNSPPVKGKQSIRNFWEAFLEAGCTDVKLETGNVGASGDLAYSLGAYSYTQAGARHAGKYLVMYRRQPDGSYRAIADSFSDNA